MRHTWRCIVAGLLLQACNQPSTGPSAPTLPTSPTAPTSARSSALSGGVKAAGLPVAGARVALLNQAGALIASTFTEGNGSYSLSEVGNVSFSGALVSVSKPDYLTNTVYILMSQDQKWDFELERAEEISVGQVIRSPVGAAARCASLGYGGGGGAVCQRFALTVPMSGTLDVTVSSTPASDFDATVLRPDGTIGVYNSALSPLRLSLQVAAGLTYQIDVVHINPATREFELSTTLR